MKLLGWAFMVAVCVFLHTANAHPVEEDDDVKGVITFGNVRFNREEALPEPNEEDVGEEDVESGDGESGEEEEEDGSENVGEEDAESGDGESGEGEEEDGKEEGGEDEPEEIECPVDWDVKNLRLTQEGDLLKAVWDEPENSENCDIKYKITFSDGVRVLTSESAQPIYEFTTPLIPCSDIDVIVTAGEGIAASASIRAETRGQGPPQLYNISSTCNSVRMTWLGEPFEQNLCEVSHFQVTCRSETQAFSFANGVTVTRVFDVDVSDLIPGSTYTCNGVIFVTGIGSSPPSETIEFSSSLGAISDLVITQTESAVVAEWSPPVNSEGCGAVSYKVVIDNQDIGSRVEETEELSINLNVPYIPCSTTTVTVTPIAGEGGKGESKTITYVNNLANINPVQNLQIENNLVTWNQPAGLGRCAVSFLVALSSSLGTQEVRTSENSAEVPLVPCSWNTIEVSPVFEDRVGPAQEVTGTVAVPDAGIVRDVSFIEIDDSLTVAWKQPSGDFGACNVTYLIYQVTIGGLLTFQTTETEQELLFIGCSESEVTIWAEVEGEPGPGATDVYETSISNIGPVRNIEITSSGVQWTQPQGLGICEVSYKVIVEDNFNKREIATDLRSVELDFIPCSELTVTVNALNDLVVGVSETVEGVAPAAAPSAPAFVSISPSFIGANITLQANPLSDNFCTLTQASVSCSNEDQISTTLLLNIADDASRQFTLDVNNLQYNNIYTCKVSWIIEAELESALSEPIVFRTVPFVPNTLVISDITSDGFLASWNEPYGPEFVVSYNILIDNLGPNYFVPEGCPQPEGANYNLLLQDQEFDFNTGLPDTAYEVKLITTYTLGITVSSNVKAVSTLPGIPEAPVGLQAFWRYGLGQTYNVSAEFSWQVPCNINGALSSFGVSVTTFAQIGSRNVEFEDAYEVEAKGAGRSYSFILADMNPFFTYLVSVNTIGGVAGPAETMFVAPPNACTCSFARSGGTSVLVV